MRLGVLLVMICGLGILPGKSQSLEFQRVNNRSHQWYLLESDHFNFYFEDSSVDLARSILPAAIEKLSQIEEKIGYRLSGRINIFTHKSVANLNASYARQWTDNESITGGITHIKSNDVHVYLTNDEVELMRQISVAIADNLLIEMLYGGTIQERIKYATLLQLPTWFHEGLIQYLANGWDTESDNLLRDLFNNVQFSSFNKLSKSKQVLIGRNIWQYIHDNEKKDAIEEILYSVRVTKKVETALLIVLNKTSRHLYSEWYFTNSALYAAELKRRIPQRPEENQLNPEKNFFFDAKLSPTASHVATSYKQKGNIKLDILDREFGTVKTIYSHFSYFDGYVQTNKELLINWCNDESLWLIENGKTPTLKQVHRSGETLSSDKLDVDLVTDFDYYPQEHVIVLSGSKMGKVNLYLFYVETGNLVPLTQSKFCDLEPHFDQNGNIYFTRILYKDEARLLVSGWQKDIFYLFRNGSEVLSTNNVTETLDINEEHPIKLSAEYLSFLSDQNGIRNAYAYKLDQKTFALSDYQTGIIGQSLNQGRSHLIETVLHSGFVFTYVTTIDSSENFGAILYPSTTKILQNRADRINNANKNNPKQIDSSALLDSEKIFFQSMFPIPKNADSLDKISHTETKKIDYTLKPKKDGVIHIQPSKAITQLNNSYFLTDEFGARFEPRKQMINRIGPVVGVTLQDQLGNHILDGRMRTTLNFSIFQYKVSYENRIGKWTERVGFISEQTRFNQNIELGKRRVRGFQYSMSKALNSRLILGFEQTTRNDHYAPILIEESSLQLNEITQTVFDQGVRMKFNSRIKRSEILFEGIQAEVSSKYRVQTTDGTMGLISNMSVGYGRKIGKNAYWISRLHMGNSSGSANNVYVLGGNRNQYRPTINNQTISIANSSYIQPVFGVRNFQMNVRSGNTFGFANSEFHYPLFSLFSKKPIKNNLLRNLWLVGFFDMGTAWYGKSPNDKLNITNRTIIQDGRLDITVYNVKNPMVYSSGIGLRKKVFGYIVRYDLAWTYDNNVVTKAVGRLSLGKPF